MSCPRKAHRPIVYQTRPLPSVLVLHTGGTLGMSSQALEARDDLEGSPTVFKEGTGGDYTKTLQPGKLLLNLVTVVPELRTFANLEVKVVMNKDSCQIGPKEWIAIAKELDAQRARFDAFIVVHGTDTMAYTASALSLMLAGFRKPIILTGSQLPLDMPRSDARQNLIDAVTCATAGFSPAARRHRRGGGVLRREAPEGEPHAQDDRHHLQRLRVAAVPATRAAGRRRGVAAGCAAAILQLSGTVPERHVHAEAETKPQRAARADRAGVRAGKGVRRPVRARRARRGAGGVRGGQHADERGRRVGLDPMVPENSATAGMMIYLTSQCESGDMHPELYATGSLAMEMGAQAGPMMTLECAVVKLMLCLAHPNLPLTVPSPASSSSSG